MTAPAWQRLGDRAIRFRRPPGAARAIAAAVRTWPGVIDVVVAPQDVAAYFKAPPAFDPAWLAALARVPDDPTPPRELELVAIYDGPDLDEVARATGLAPAELARVHAAATYVVDSIGFAPGFAYLTGLDRRLALPRRATPRPRVPAGSLAIAGGYTAVYPFDSPGGWHLIGRVAGAMFGEGGARLQLGDRVRFVALRAEAAP
jgi:KipI family sensor histidine kinase inhibitor